MCHTSVYRGERSQLFMTTCFQMRALCVAVLGQECGVVNLLIGPCAIFRNRRRQLWHWFSFKKAESEVKDIQKEEKTSKPNYDMLKQSLGDHMSADTKDREDERAAKAGQSHGGKLLGGIENAEIQENDFATNPHMHANCS